MVVARVWTGVRFSN